MNCQKCNQPMKEYLGLFETGWDCVNANCGKEIVLDSLGKEFTITFEPIELKYPISSKDDVNLGSTMFSSYGFPTCVPFVPITLTPDDLDQKFNTDFSYNHVVKK